MIDRRLSASFAIVVAVAVFSVPVPSHAQTQEIGLENDRVRVLELEYPPRTSSGLHTHEFPRLVIVLSPGTVELVSDSNRVRRVVLRENQLLWRPAETHDVRNIGTTTVRLTEVEIKNDPTAAPGNP